uniref:Rep_fac-A_C domain-containing protein n=1 Tax=Strongyloides papillosus TaxID=174720 RepID=A0A0N5BMH6_STREA
MIQEEEARHQRQQEEADPNNGIIKVRNIDEAKEVIALRRGNVHFELRGRLVSVKPGMTYQACLKEFCRKKVSWENGFYQCSKCGAQSTRFYNALLVVLEILNNTDRHSIVAFDDVARRFLGRDGQTVAAFEGKYGEKLARDEVVERFLGRGYTFVINATCLTRWILSTATPC